MSFEDNLLKFLEARKVEDPVSSFLMSLAPQIKLLNQGKQNQIFIEFLQVIQKVTKSPSQNTHITPAINNVNSWSIQPPISTFYDRSNDAYSTAINHRQHNNVNITPHSSSSTSLGLGAYQSASAAAIPQLYYNPNSTQTVTAPVSPSTSDNTLHLFKPEY